MSHGFMCSLSGAGWETDRFELEQLAQRCSKLSRSSSLHSMLYLLCLIVQNWKLKTYFLFYRGLIGWLFLGQQKFLKGCKHWDNLSENNFLFQIFWLTCHHILDLWTKLQQVQSNLFAGLHISSITCKAGTYCCELHELSFYCPLFSDMQHIVDITCWKGSQRPRALKRFHRESSRKAV